MMIRDGHIGYKGWVCLVILNETVKMFDSSLHLLTKEGRQSAWLMGIIGGLFNLVFVFGVIKFMRSNPNQGFLEVLEKKVGKWAKILYGLFAFHMLVFTGCIHARLSIDQIKIITMPNTPFFVLETLILGLAVLLVIKGIEPLSRLTTLLMPYLIITFVSLFFLLYEHFDFTNLFPLFGPGVGNITVKGIKNSLYFGEPLALCIFASFVREQTSFEKGLFRGAIISLMMICLILFFFQLTMGTPVTSDIAFPFIEMTRLIYVNRFIQHLEGFYATIWLFMDFTDIAINLYLSTVVFSMIFSIKNFRPVVWGIVSIYFILILSPNFFYQTLTIESAFLTWGGLITYAQLIMFAMAAKAKKVFFSS